MLFELHGHTTRYSSCSQMSPVEYLRAARDRGLAGICLTEHNTFWPEAEFAELCKAARGLVIINGNEQRCWDGDFLQGDFLVYGSRFHLERPTAQQLVDIVHNAAGIIVAAHPFRGELGVSEELVYQLDLDALEVYSCCQEPWQTKLAYEISQKIDMPLIASSDAHVPELVGYSAIEFTVSVHNEQEFVAAIKKRQFQLRPHGE